jgi:hypothetical protein
MCICRLACHVDADCHRGASLTFFKRLPGCLEALQQLLAELAAGAAQPHHYQGAGACVSGF